MANSVGNCNCAMLSNVEEIGDHLEVWDYLIDQTSKLVTNDLAYGNLKRLLYVIMSCMSVT